MTTRYGHWCLGAAVALVVMGGLATETETHTPIASRWNYNEHLFPIFRDNCGSCHREGGIAPMSLVTYRTAYPWAQSIREEVLGLRMPPWKAEDGFGDFRNGHALPAREMDMILEWSSGGYPQGPRSLRPVPPSQPETWPLGAPAVELRMPEPFTLDAGTTELVRYFVLPTEIAEDRFMIGADVMPGAAAVVRDVAIYVDVTGAARALDAEDDGPGFGEAEGRDFPTTAPIALWSPGRPSVLQEGDAARRLPAGADVVARVHYKKTWITEGEAFVDQSRIGLYVGDGRARGGGVDARIVAGRCGRPGLELQPEDRAGCQRARHPAGGRSGRQERADHGGDARRDSRAAAVPARAGHGVAHPLLVRHRGGPAGRLDDRGQRGPAPGG